MPTVRARRTADWAFSTLELSSPSVNTSKAFLPVTACKSFATRNTESNSAVLPAARVRNTARLAASLSVVKGCTNSSCVLKAYTATESLGRSSSMNLRMERFRTASVFCMLPVVSISNTHEKPDESASKATIGWR